MNRVLMGALILSALAVREVRAVDLPKIGAGANVYHCQQDGEISASERKGVEDTAMAFVQAVHTSNIDLTYSMLTKEVRSSVSKDNFSSEIKSVVEGVGPFSIGQIQHAYYIESVGGGPEGRAICGPLANDGWVTVQIKAGQAQAHVVIEAKTRNNDWAITLWLLPEGNIWQVQYFNFGISSMVGITPEILLQRARHERDSGHAFNAAMLYAGVQGSIDRGPAFQLAISQTLREDLAKFKTPPELSGTPPHVWTLNGTKYDVGRVTILGIDSELGLTFDLPQKVWTDQKHIDAHSRTFINDFIAAHPDYSREFQFLVASALKPDNSGGFRTIYEAGKGFD